MKIPLFALIASALFVVLSLAPSGFAQTAAVRMASLQNDLHHLPLLVAVDKGFFQDAGVEVQQSAVFRAGPELMTAMSAGSIDMGYVGEAPATIAFAQGAVPVRLVAQVNTGGSALVVAADSPAKGVADLKGSRIAVPGNGTVQDFLLRHALMQAGLQATDIRIIALPAPEMATALKKGQIDGFLVWQPFPARAVVHKEGRILVDSADLWPDHPCCALVARQESIANGSAAKVVRAHVRAVNFIKENPEAAVQIAIRHTGMDEATVREALAHVSYATEPIVEGEEEYVKFLHNIGYIKQKDSKRFTDEFIQSLVP